MKSVPSCVCGADRSTPLGAALCICPRGNDVEPLRIEGVVAVKPQIMEARDGRRSCVLEIRATGPVGKGPMAQNVQWVVVVHRQPAVEILRAAEPGDIIHLTGVVQGGAFLVPDQIGRAELILIEGADDIPFDHDLEEAFSNA